MVVGQTLGRGLFSRVVHESEDVASKIIDIDMQVAPHSYKAEIAALDALKGCHGVIAVISTEVTTDIEPECIIRTPYFPFTLDSILFESSKAKFPPGSGWMNVLPERRVLEITHGIAAALRAVHEKGIIHRDIKPENILFSAYNGEPILIDFGISWVPGLGEHPKVTDIATNVYKAPELLLGLDTYDTSVDIWALGCVVAKLASKDTEPLFTPYRSDINLLSDQFLQLGTPSLESVPSLEKTSISSMAILPARPFDIRFLHDLVGLLLVIEPTSRPTAERIVQITSSRLEQLTNL